MHLSHITLRNFKCFEELNLTLDPCFNLIVGINGSGKTALLEGLRLAIGSFYLGLDKSNALSAPGFLLNDVTKYPNLATKTTEALWPVAFSATGQGNGQHLEWSRSRNGAQNRTTYAEAEAMKKFASALQEGVKKGKNVTLPLIAYYSVHRYKPVQRNQTKLPPRGSRIGGYFNALETISSLKNFRDLLVSESWEEFSSKDPSPLISAAQETTLGLVDNLQRMFYSPAVKDIVFEFSNKTRRTYDILPEGTRLLVSLAIELAMRCVMLNPSLGLQAMKQTPGVVLIDELDLHLHPSWQTKVIEALTRFFPKVQFVATTHSPLVVGSLKKGKLFALKNYELHGLSHRYGEDANLILHTMEASERQPEVQQLLNAYFIEIENGRNDKDRAQNLRQQLEQLLGPDHSELQRADSLLSFLSL